LHGVRRLVPTLVVVVHVLVTVQPVFVLLQLLVDV